MNDRIFRVAVALSVFALVGMAGAGVVAAQDATVVETNTDYTSLEYAVDNATAGQTVQVQDSYDGSNDTFPITVNKDLTINGTANAVVSGPTNTNVIEHTAGTLNVSDLTIEAESASGVTRGIRSTGGTLNVDNAVLNANGTDDDNYVQLLDYRGNNGGSVTNSVFNVQYSDAIHVRTTSLVTVDGNTFNGIDSEQAVGVNTNSPDGEDNVEIINNNFDNLGSAVLDFGVLSGTADNMTVNGNTVTNSDGLLSSGGTKFSTIAAAGLDSQFDITSVDANSTVNQGTNETYEVSVENTGTAQDAKNVSVVINASTNVTATEELVLDAGETGNVTLEPNASSLGVGTYEVFVQTNDSNDDEVRGELTVSDPDARNFIDGNIGDDQLNPIDNAGNVTLNVTYIGGSGDRVSDLTLISRVEVSELDNIQDIIDDPVDNRVDDAVGDAGYNPTAPDERDEYFINLPNFGDGTTFLVEANLEGFGAFDGPTTPAVGPGQQAVRDIRLERLINADDLEIDKTPANGRVDLDGTITDNVTVYTNDTEPAGVPAPLSDTPVNITVVDSTVGEYAPGVISEDDLVITPTPPANTGPNGAVEFQISLDQASIDADAIDGEVDFTLEFEAEQSGTDEPAVTQLQNITFVGEPPSGDGTIAGDVEEITPNAQSNTKSAGGIGVHAVNTDRVDSNTFGFNTTTGLGGPAITETWTVGGGKYLGATSVPGEGNDYGNYFRVAELDDTGAVSDILDVQTDYLVEPSANAYSQNISIPGTGFTSDSTTGVAVAPLEPGDYQIQYSADGSFDAPNRSNFTADQNLTYKFTEQRYNGSAAVHTDVTRDDGTYELYNLYTNGDLGKTYVTIAADDTAGLGFANFRGYDTVRVEENSDSSGVDNTGQLETDLTVFDVEVEADTVNAENLGQLPSEADADKNYTSALDKSEPNTIERNGRAVDVIQVNTSVEGSLIGAEAVVNITDTSGAFNGQFLDRSVGGQITDYSTDKITVDTTPNKQGTAVVFLQTDGALPKDVSVEIEAALESGLDSEFIGGNVGEFNPGKQFVGVTEYDSGSIKGDIARDDDALTDTFVWTREIEDSTGNYITIEPDFAGTPGVSGFTDLQSDSDVETLNFTVEFNDSATSTPVDESFTATGDELRDIDLQDKIGPIDAPAVSSFNLLRFANPIGADNPGQYSMDRVPAQDPDGVEYQLIEARQYDTGEKGTTNIVGAQAITPGLTRNADITIPGAVVESDYQLSNLVPADANVTEGDAPIDVLVDIDNEGIDAGEQDLTLEVTNASGDVVYSDTVADVVVAAQDNTTVTFTDVPAGNLTPGDYTHTVASDDDSVSGNLTVEAADGDNGNGDNGSTTDNPLFDESGEPMGDLDVITVLTEWNDTGEINGEEVDDLELIGYLTEWNEAQNGN